MLHLLRSVRECVLSRFVVFRLLLGLVWVVTLSAEEEEDIAPACLRLVDIDREISTLVAVVKYIVELGITAFLVAFRLCTRIAVLRIHREYGLELNARSLVLVRRSQFDDASQGVRMGELVNGGRIVLVGVGIAAATIKRHVAQPVLDISHRLHLVALVVGNGLLPAVYLVVTPLHLILCHELFLGLPFLRYHHDVGAFCSIVIVVLAEPGGKEHVAGVVDKGTSLCLGSKVLRQIAVACLLPLGNHHFFYFVGRIHEVRRHAVAQAHGYVVLQGEGGACVFAEEAHLAALSHQQVRRIAYIDVALRTDEGAAGAGRYILCGSGCPRSLSR